MQKEIQTTADGSHTIYLPELDEHYHSTHGAIQESLHVYINEGLSKLSKKEVSVLEIGFGTGLNAFLTFGYALQNNIRVHYCSLEKFPLNEQEVSQLNYASEIFPEYAEIFEQIHQAKWNSPEKINDSFVLEKLNVDLLEFDFPEKVAYDLVYYDAFAPNRQPEMWADPILKKVAETVAENGIWVTYCAKGAVRRALNSFGFAMERIPGPPGKKEILRGKKASL